MVVVGGRGMRWRRLGGRWGGFDFFFFSFVMDGILKRAWLFKA